jgi:K+-sensing histidine kinase KdpD
MNSGNARKLLEIQSRYQLDVKQKEIELLKSRTELVESNIKYQRRLTWIMTFLTILLLATTLQFYLSYRNKKSANRMFEKIFSIIAHDLRSPVSAMNNLAGLLNKNEIILTDQERRNLMFHIEGLTQSLMGLLENLLNWSRSRSGIIEYNPEVLALDELIEESVALINPVALNKQITIEKQMESGLKVYADKNGTMLIIRNLMANAIKYSKSGGKIKILVYKQNKSVVVGIQDFGIGIAPDKLQNLVKGLNTQSQTGTMNEKGTGMGLRLCNDFVKVNKGKLWAESVENEQTIFYFSLPVSKL